MKMLALSIGKLTIAVIVFRRWKLSENSHIAISGAAKAIAPAASTTIWTEDGTFGPQGPPPTKGKTAVAKPHGNTANRHPYTSGVFPIACWMLKTNPVSASWFGA